MDTSQPAAHDLDADNAITSAKIADGSIAGTDIGPGTITGDKIAFGTITGGRIQNGSIVTDDIADNSLTGTDIADGTITGTDIADGTITGTDLAAAAQPAGVAFADGTQFLELTTDAQSVRDVVLDAPAPGHVIVTASGFVQLGSLSYDGVGCSITDGAIATDDAHLIVADDLNVPASAQAIPLSGTRTFEVPAGPTTFRLVCFSSGVAFFYDSQITALYVPALYAP